MVAGVAALLLALDVQLFTPKPEAKGAAGEIAKIEVVRSSVRRRAHDLPVWDQAAVDASLYVKDFVFTDEAAGAILRFGDGTVVELGENTLVAIEKLESSSVLNVIRGSLRVDAAPEVIGAFAAAPKLALKVPGQSGTVRPGAATSLALKVEKSGAVKVAVHRGVAEIFRERTKVSAGEEARVSEKPEAPVVVVQQEVRLAAPAHGAKVAAAGTELSWEARGFKGSARVEIARDERFAQLVHKVEVGTSRLKVPPLAAGEYFWRVVAGEAASEARRFAVVIEARTVKPELLAPFNGERLSGEDVRARLIWRAVPGAKGYRVSWGAEEMRVVATSVTTPPLASGAYEWRVRVDEVGAEWSEMRAFGVSVVAGMAAKLRVVAAAGAEKAVAAGSGAAGAPVDAVAGNAANALALMAPLGESVQAADPVVVEPATVLEPAAVLEPEPVGAAEPIALAPPAPVPEPLGLAEPAPVQEPIGLAAPAPVPLAVAEPAPASQVAAAPVPTPTEVAVSAEPTATNASAAPPPDASPPPSTASSTGVTPTAEPTKIPEPVAASAAPARSPDAAEAPAQAPHSWLSAAFAPTALSYVASGEDPETKIKATLFNSWLFATQLWPLPAWAIDLSFHRTGTVLFRKPDAKTPAGQRPLIVQPFSFAASVRRRLADAIFGLLKADVRFGYAMESSVRFHRRDGNTLAARHIHVHGLALGFELAAKLAAVRLKLGGEYALGLFSVPDEKTSSRLYAGTLLLEIPIGDWWALETGFLARHHAFTVASDESVEVDVDTRALLIQLKWRF